MKQDDIFAAGAQRLQMTESIELTIQSKRCNRCKLEKPLAAFGRAARERDGLRAECKECRATAYLANAEALRAKQHAYYHHNVEARRAAQAAYNRANAKRIAASMVRRRADWSQEERERAAAQKAAWKFANPEKVKASSAAARHARRAAPGRFSTRQWLLLCALYGHRCACCGNASSLTPDHIVALSRGGTNHIANIQPLCLDCNRRKWVRPVIYGLMPYYNPAAMLADLGPWLTGDVVLDVVYANGAVQPRLFSEEDVS
jgi:5-methylcytosine-specific restriction endonuclease McrA